MSQWKKHPVLKAIDLPMLVAAALTVVFYVVVNQESFAGSMIRKYTTEHIVEYVVVAFFIWGLVDVVFRLCGLPVEVLALRRNPLPERTATEPVSSAEAMYSELRAQPPWFLDSRFGQRLMKALTYLQEKESADGFNDYLHYLAAQDEDRTHANYALLRFICWVAPVLGILGTVIHFGSAFGGLSVDEIEANIGKVVGEIGTAFNTTTVALAAAITMMFSMFLCERTERSIIHGINRRIDRELQNRFEVFDETLTPFLDAVKSTNQTTVQTVAASVERQLQIWSAAAQQLQQKSEQRLQAHAQLWEQTLAKTSQRFEQSDTQREQKLLKLLEEAQAQRTDHRAQVQAMLTQMAGFQAQTGKLVETLSGLLKGEGELAKLQHKLAENLEGLRGTQQLDQAMHGLTAAIHLLTARHEPDTKKTGRAA